MKLFAAFCAIILLSTIVLAGELHTVIKVLDGDTVLLETGKRVRLIGLDTPELKPFTFTDPYYAREAYNFTKGLCEGKEVRLEYDEANSKAEHLDKYGRILAYVYLENGTFVNAEIVKQGYGFTFARFPFKYLDVFREYQKMANEKGRGIWPHFNKDPDREKIKVRYEAYLKAPLE